MILVSGIQGSWLRVQDVRQRVQGRRKIMALYLSSIAGSGTIKGPVPERHGP